MFKDLKLPPTNDPETALFAVVALRRVADKLERAAIRKAIDQGFTWSQIAEILGVSKQAAHKKHAHLVPKQ